MTHSFACSVQDRRIPQETLGNFPMKRKATFHGQFVQIHHQLALYFDPTMEMSR
jgi:hypothetical protein